MNNIKMQVDKKEYVLYYDKETLIILDYMNEFKMIKKRLRNYIKHEKDCKREVICTYSFISSFLNNPELELKDLGNDKEFIIERKEVK